MSLFKRSRAANTGSFMILGKEPSWSIPADVDPDRREREVLPPGSRGEVYARGMDMGCLFGICYGLFVGGAVVAICFLTAPSWKPAMQRVLSSQDREVMPRLEPLLDDRSRRAPSTEVPLSTTPPTMSGIPSQRHCLESGPNRPSGECCVPAGSHMRDPEHFRPDPEYQGRGHWVCGGERATRAIRNRDGTVNVSRCNWCEP